VSCVKMAELIEMQFGMRSLVGSWNCVLDKGAHWRHLAIMIEPSVCGGDVSYVRLR